MHNNYHGSCYDGEPNANQGFVEIYRNIWVNGQKMDKRLMENQTENRMEQAMETKDMAGLFREWKRFCRASIGIHSSIPPQGRAQEWIQGLSEPLRQPARELLSKLELTGRGADTILQTSGRESVLAWLKGPMVQALRSQLNQAAPHVNLQEMGAAVHDQLTLVLGGSRASDVTLLIAEALIGEASAPITHTEPD